MVTSFFLLGEKMSEHWIRFYTAYPKKEGRGNALKSWEKITRGMTTEELEAFTQKAVTAINSQKLSRWDASDRKFIPMPATWLNQSRWDDEIPSSSQPSDRPEKKNETCACGKPAFNRNVCSRCYTKMADPVFQEHMRHNLRNMGFTKKPGESWRDASMRCLRNNGLVGLLPKPLAGEA